MAPSLIVFHIAIELRATQSCSSFHPEPMPRPLPPRPALLSVRPFPLLAPRKGGLRRPPPYLPPASLPSCATPPSSNARADASVRTPRRCWPQSPGERRTDADGRADGLLEGDGVCGKVSASVPTIRHGPSLHTYLSCSTPVDLDTAFPVPVMEKDAVCIVITYILKVDLREGRIRRVSTSLVAGKGEMRLLSRRGRGTSWALLRRSDTH